MVSESLNDSGRKILDQIPTGYFQVVLSLLFTVGPSGVLFACE